VPRRLEEHFLRTVQTLPAATQTLLLVAAADTSGETAVVFDAASRLGVSSDAANAARDTMVVGTGPDLMFRHPLIRSAVYTGASTADRRQAHAALAEALELREEPNRRIWHLAAAAPGPQEDLAELLADAARRATERGAHASAATLWLRAAELSVEPLALGERSLAAVNAHLAAGAPHRAQSLLVDVDASLIDPFQRAQRLYLLGCTRYVLGEAVGTTTMLMDAARDLQPYDLDMARDAARYAMVAARIANRFAHPGEDYWDASAQLEAMPSPPRDEARLVDRLMDGQAALWRDYTEAVSKLRPCLDALVEDDDVTPNGLLWISSACWAAGAIADETRLHALAERLVADTRRRQAPEALCAGLLWLGLSELMSGSLVAARRHFAEGTNILDAVGQQVTPLADIFAVLMSAWAGQPDQARTQAQMLERAALERSHGWVMSFLEYAITVLELGLGNYAAAFAAAMTDFRHHPLLAVMAVPDMIEAAVRSGQRAAAERALEDLASRAVPSGTPLALGLLDRSRALLADDDVAEPLYQRALVQLDQSGSDLQVARTQLLYGEWLRRRRRRADAREQLRAAYATFDAIGAAAFAERSRIELAATGAHARRRTVDTLHDLTPHESQIAELASTGSTNAEIAATLFISSSTVDYHLGKIYRKLGINSRRELLRTEPARSH
jgi:DNA-binding CsgD family transcriptional regulator